MRGSLTSQQTKIVEEAGRWYEAQREYFEAEICRLITFGEVNEETARGVLYAAVLENIAEGLGKQYKRSVDYQGIRKLSIMG